MACDLRVEGFSIPYIAACLNVGWATVHRYLKGAPIPPKVKGRDGKTHRNVAGVRGVRVKRRTTLSNL